MTAYVDSSVLLRIVLGEPGRLREWGRIRSAYSSVLIRLECLRTIDRARLVRQLSDTAVATQRARVLEQIDGLSLVAIDDTVLARAADPFPTSLGSLDAVHLTTALRLQHLVPELMLATHDEELGLAARAVGIPVIGTLRPAAR